MPKKYTIISTQEDIKLRVFGADKSELFRHAALGMLEILKPSADERTAVERKITVEADDDENLLLEFLNEALSQMRLNKECYREFELRFKNENKLEAVLKGFKLMGFGGELKRGDYCDLRIFRNEKGVLECEVVFNI
ncbi:MAG: archease [Patescibacteria group bacterium]